MVVKFLVFDNIQFMSRTKDGKTADKAGVASRMFKDDYRTP